MFHLIKLVNAIITLLLILKKALIPLLKSAIINLVYKTNLQLFVDK